MSKSTPHTYDYPIALSFVDYHHHIKYFSLKYEHFQNKLIITYNRTQPLISDFHSENYNYPII